MNGGSVERSELPGWVKVLAVTGLLIGLLALVSVAAGEGKLTGEGGLRLPGSPMLVADVVFTLAVTLFGLGAVLAVIALTRVRPDRSPGGHRTIRDLLIFFLLAGLLWAAISDAELNSFVEERLIGGELVTGQGQGQAGEARPEDQAEFIWPIAMVLGVLGLAAIVMLAGRREPSGGTAAALPEPPAAASLALVLDETLADLTDEADPRRAVIAAYARMERVLGAHGHPRRAYEAPFEYLARILRELNVRAAAVLALTELFERAKFSLHEIDGSMKEEALEALAAVRDDLRAFAAA